MRSSNSLDRLGTGSAEDSGGEKDARCLKEPILRNNFDPEPTAAENGPQNAPPSPKTTPPSGTNGPPNPTPGAPDAGPISPKARTGPKTPRGKRAVSRNAIKHAIFSPNPVVIAGLETIDEWEDFQAQIAESWTPVGRYERELAYDIAFGLRRLQRCRIQEAAQLTRQVEEIEDELIAEANDDDDDDEGGDSDRDDDRNERPSRPLRPVEPDRLRAHQLLNLIPDGFAIDRALRYETHARRALLQSVHELEARQARRLGERPPLARVDFTAGPSLRSPSARGSTAYEQLNQSIDRAQRDLATRRRARRSAANSPAEDES